MLVNRGTCLSGAVETASDILGPNAMERAKRERARASQTCSVQAERQSWRMHCIVAHSFACPPVFSNLDSLDCFDEEPVRRPDDVRNPGELLEQPESRQQFLAVAVYVSLLDLPEYLIFHAPSQRNSWVLCEPPPELPQLLDVP